MYSCRNPSTTPPPPTLVLCNSYFIGMCDNFIPDFRYSTLTPISQTAISLFFVDSWILLIPITASNIIAGGAGAEQNTVYHSPPLTQLNSTQLSIASPLQL